MTIYKQMNINYENHVAVNQTVRGNETVCLTAHYFGRNLGGIEFDNMFISIRTRLLCIAAAFALALTAVPPPS